MTTLFYNDTRTGANLSFGNDITVILGRDALWTNTSAVQPVLTVGTGSRARIAGQIYAEASAISNSLQSNAQIEVFEGAVVTSGEGSAARLEGADNYVSNFGYMSGVDAITFTESGNNVFNAGTLIAQANGVTFGAGTLTDWIDNSGSIVSIDDDGIQYNGSGLLIVVNSGTISAQESAAILVSGSGAVRITNSGTIEGALALSLGGQDDVVINTGLIEGAIALGSGNDAFDGSRGIASAAIAGGSGDDELIGGTLADRLDGGDGIDVLTGSDGNDVLTGGTGADELTGGEGRDAASYSNATGAIVADLLNPAGNTGAALGDTYSGIEMVFGSGFDDQLFGDAAHNTLRGNGGADLLDGRAGGDVMIGGIGDDLYVVDSVRDQVVERTSEGIDRVDASVSYTLSVDVENLALTGVSGISATGNALGNLLIGNGGGNALHGLSGNDVLNGGNGADRFYFETALDAANNVDAILDFAVGTDRIVLSRAIFTEVTGGAGGLTASRFATGAAAGDASDRIVYDPATGNLFYDPDGTGGISQTLFAQLSAGLTLSPADFIVAA